MSTVVKNRKLFFKKKKPKDLTINDKVVKTNRRFIFPKSC